MLRPANWLLPLLLTTACGEAPEPSAPGQAQSSEPRAVKPGPDSNSRAAPLPPPAGPDSAAQPMAPAPIVLPDEAKARGLDYVNRSGTPEKATILEANGAGVAVLDLAGDGDLDLVFSQGLPSLAQAVQGPGADLEVFENDGTGHFSRGPAPGLSGWWTGLATGDLDGDGREDLVAGGYGGLVALRQTEAGSLVPLEALGLFPPDAPPGALLVPCAERSVGQIPWWTTSVALADFNLDGVLDLFVGGYLELDPLAPPIGELGNGVLSIPCQWKGYPVYCGPRGMTPQPDRLLIGRGDGSFRAASAEEFPEITPAFTLGLAPFDADLDGDTDLYVANDSVANRLWINEIGGATPLRLVDRALSAGVALNQDGMAEAGMGVAVADVDHDGRQDLCVTNFSDEPTQLFLGAKIGFRTATYQLGLGHQTRRLLSWGVHLVDFDGDSFVELLTANGHVYPQADRADTGTRYGQPATLFRLWPNPRALKIEPGGPQSLLAPELGSRGSAIGDFDRDGRPDVVLVRIDGPAALGIDDLGPENHRLQVRLIGPEQPGPGPRQTSRSAHGAVLIALPEFAPEVAEADRFALLGELQTASGYQSASSPWIHFGLGENTKLQFLEVRWPSGAVEHIEGLRADRRVTIQEGRGVLLEEPWK